MTGVYTDMFTVPVCNIFEETMLDGQLCYQADLDRFRNMVDKKEIATEGFVFLLDYNENRMLDNGEDNFLLQKNEKEAMIYVQTIGENNKFSKLQTLRKTPQLLWMFFLTISLSIFSGFAKIAIPFIFYRASATLWKGRLCFY